MWNFETHSVTNFRDVMAEFNAFDPHLVLMDIGLLFSTVITGAVRSERSHVYR